MAKYDTSFLYPEVGDPMFSFKIATRKEFADTAEVLISPAEDVDAIATKLCSAEFELAPHQAFVRNFMSFQTPYDGMLLYHGLGTGKTCSAISVCEEMRAYMLQMDISKRIIVVASPNVQENFKLQLFDSRKLKLIDGLWSLQACTGNGFIQEINPMAMKGLPRDKVIRQIRSLINKSYLFLGYVEFANYIASHEEVDQATDDKTKANIVRSRLRNTFKGRLVVIDEVHNIRDGEDGRDKAVSSKLEMLVNNAGGMRLLFLSATPMYNSPREIAWLLNLLHVNDGRASFTAKDLFNKGGNILTEDVIGGTVLSQKAIGYVSFVRGDNPYTFPFRVWPKQFAPDRNLDSSNMPTMQLNGRAIVQGVEILSLYATTLGEYQARVYDYILKGLSNTGVKRAFSDLDGFGYTILQRPLEALNMTFPSVAFDSGKDVDPSSLVGTKGLEQVVSFTINESTLARSKFVYKNEYRSDSPFLPTNISKYSAKIANVLESVGNSEGVVLVYSQYIDGGIVPTALALEESGYRRATPELGLLQDPPPSNGAKYIVISGDRGLSPNNTGEVQLATNESNKDGAEVKVVLISLAGSEGLDFKFIRQVHVIDPWYNMNRVEQIIGRAVRTCSHRSLPLIERNVMIFLYVSLIPGKANTEAADVYVYRVAEGKAVSIGMVSRVLKEYSTDCLLRSNIGADLQSKEITQRLANGQNLQISLGSEPFSAACDYMEKCQYSCKPISSVTGQEVTLDTFAKSFILANADRLVTRVRQLFRQRYFYTKTRLVAEINANKKYPLVQINAALQRLVTDGNEFLTDQYGRTGRLQNIADLYLFMPLELSGNSISLYDRKTPVQYKRKYLTINTEGENGELTTVQTEQQSPVTNDVIKDVIANINTTISRTQGLKWYEIAGQVFQVLTKTGMDKSRLTEALSGHAYESLSYKGKIRVLESVSQLKNSGEASAALSAYLSKRIIRHEDSEYMLILKDGMPTLVTNSPRGWEQAGSSATREVSSIINKQALSYLPFDEKCAAVLGFMALWKEDNFVFKVKNTRLVRNKGARCDQSSKSSLQKNLTSIGFNKYANESSFGRTELCCCLELLLRVMEDDGKDGLKWFASPAMIVYLERLKQ
tara:strand:+ start:13314 stop:16655 length:3342 start_codon:yes stop_codon:yes gene_type:complete